jgi:hypothetical protein
MNGMPQDGGRIKKASHGGHLGTLDERDNVSNDLFVVLLNYNRIRQKNTSLLIWLLGYPKKGKGQVSSYAAQEKERYTALYSYMIQFARPTAVS